MGRELPAASPYRINKLVCAGPGVLCLYFMGLNLSNEQIAQELDTDPDDAQVMASRLREGIVERKPEVRLSGEVECDEVYVVVGHKGHPAAVAKKGGPAAEGA